MKEKSNGYKKYTANGIIVRDTRNAIEGLDYRTVTINVHNAKI